MKIPRQKTYPAVRGFSAIELLVVLGIIMIVIGMSIPSIVSTLKEARVRSGYEDVVSAMRRAHEVTVDRRRVVVLTFTAAGGGNPATIVFRQEDLVPANPPNPSTYILSPAVNTPNPETIQLPSDMDFVLPANPLPAVNPDGLPAAGSPNSATDYGYNNATGVGGSLNQMFFQANGQVLMTSETGPVADGVIYVGRAGDANSFRAVSILGQTARVKGWRLVGGVWREY